MKLKKNTGKAALLALALAGCSGTPQILPALPCEARSADWCWRCWQDDVERQADVDFKIEDCR